MESVKELILEVAGMLCFCLAVSLFIYLVKQFDLQIDQVTRQLYEQHAIFPY